MSAGGWDASAWTVSRLSEPVEARRRAEPITNTIARPSEDEDDDDGMTATAAALPTSSKKMPLFHGKTKLKPSPRKNEPMMTSTAHIMRNIVNIAMANLRSFGLCDGFLSMNGAIASSASATPGIGHARRPSGGTS